jgi:hypothetical protein
LVQVIDHVDSGMVPMTPELYSEATQAYTGIMARQRGAALMDSLVKACNIEYNDSALAKDIGTVPAPTWAAIVNGVDTITFERLPDYLYQYKSTFGLDTVTIQNVKDMLFQLAQRFLLMQFGNDIGYNNRPAVVKEREGIYHKYAMNIIRNTGYDPDYNPPESLIEKYYNLNIDKYIFKKPIYVQHIIVDDSLFGEYLRDQALSGVDFLDLAEEYYPGEPEIRRAAADLGYIGPGEMPDAFYNAAIATRVKSVSHPVKTEWGYHIIKVIDKKNNRPLDDARFEIIDDLKLQHRKQTRVEWKKEILGRHQIVYHLDKMAKIKLFGKSNL